MLLTRIYCNHRECLKHSWKNGCSIPVVLLNSKCISMEKGCMKIYLIANSQNMPTNTIANTHIQAMQIPI